MSSVGEDRLVDEMSSFSSGALRGRSDIDRRSAGRALGLGECFGSTPSAEGDRGFPAHLGGFRGGRLCAYHDRPKNCILKPTSARGYNFLAVTLQLWGIKQIEVFIRVAFDGVSH